MKKKVLLHWFEMPGRPELTDIFVYNDPSLEFVHLYHLNAEERTVVYSPYKMIFWYDYNSPVAMLKNIKPDIVITPNGDSLYEVALLVAANHLGIKTYCMQHGLIAPSFYEEVENIKLKRSLKKFFYYSKLGVYYTNLLVALPARAKLQVVRFLADFVKGGQFDACLKNRFPLRLPNRYICFTRHNAHYFFTRDGAVEDRIIEIGIPFFDHIFQLQSRQQKTAVEVPYLLFIDTRLIKEGFPVPVEVMNDYYKKLNTFAKAQGLQLKIKLHPWSYQEENLLKDENIVYLADVKMDVLIKEVISAEAVFSFFSTLLFPIFFLHKKVVGIEYEGSYFPEDMKENDYLTVINLFHGIPENFDLAAIELHEKFTGSIQEKYLYRVDGRSKERLQQVLKSSVGE